MSFELFVFAKEVAFFFDEVVSNKFGGELEFLAEVDGFVV